MGCTNSINKLPGGEPDPSKIIRLDLQMIKTAATPKNEINLMKLTEELLKAISILCMDNTKQYERFES